MAKSKKPSAYEKYDAGYEVDNPSWVNKESGNYRDKEGKLWRGVPEGRMGMTNQERKSFKNFKKSK